MHISDDDKIKFMSMESIMGLKIKKKINSLMQLYLYPYNELFLYFCLLS